MLIELDNVSLERGTTRILDRISLSIPQSQHVAIVGPNGSGKSTLLKLLMKFFYPSVIDGNSGTVKILGREEWNVWDLRAHLGFVSAEIDHHFCSGRSARLNALQTVLTGFSASELEPELDCITMEMKTEAMRCLALFGMTGNPTKLIGHMSSGERRRVLLARALVMDPKAIILDEPTSGLDILARARLLNEVNYLATSGTQILLVTHHLEELLPCIQRTILLKGGRVFFDGPTVEAIDEANITSLFDAKVRIERDVDGYFHAILGDRQPK